MKLARTLVIIIMTSIILTSFAIPGGEGQDGEREFRYVHMNLKANDEFNPEYEYGNDTMPQTRRVEAEYIELIIGRAERDWVDVGTWTSDPLENAITLRELVTFNIWSQEAQSGYDGNPDWEFNLYHNDDRIAQASLSNAESSKSRPIEVTTTANIAEPVNVTAGDTIGIYIRYRAWEDCDVYYDTIEYDSGASASMDSLIIFNAKKKVTARFYDAWGINWDGNGKYFCSVDDAGRVTMGNDETEIAPGGEVKGENDTIYLTMKITFKGIPVKDGHVVTVSMKYGPNETSEGWNYTYKFSEDDDDEFPAALAGGSVLVIILIIIFGFLFIKKKKAKEYVDKTAEEVEEEYKEEPEDEETIHEEGTREEYPEVEETGEEYKEKTEEEETIHEEGTREEYPEVEETVEEHKEKPEEDPSV